MQKTQLQPKPNYLNLPNKLLVPCFEAFFDERGDRPILAPGAQQLLRLHASNGDRIIAIANTGHRGASFEELESYFRQSMRYTPWIRAIVFGVGGAKYWVTYRTTSAFIDRNLPPADRPGDGAIWLAKYFLSDRVPSSTLVIGNSKADAAAAESGWYDYLDIKSAIDIESAA